MAHHFSQKLCIYTICLAIISMALSISATHIFVALSFLFFLHGFFFNLPKNASAGKAKHTEGLVKQTKRACQAAFRQNRLLFLGGLYYLWLLFASLLRFSDDWKLLQRAFASEISDSALYLFGVLIFAKTRKDKDSRRLIGMAFRVMAILLVLSGLVALFSEFRPGRLLSGHGFVPSAENRPQHKLIELFGIQLYRPVGFMNTHLTFGGLLLLSLPILFSSFRNKSNKKYTKSELHERRKFEKIFAMEAAMQRGYPLWLLLGFVVLFANGARSVLLGVLLLYPPLLLALLKIRMFRLWKYLFAAGSLCVLFLAAGTLSIKYIKINIKKYINAASQGTALSGPGANQTKTDPSHILHFQKLQEKIRHTDYTRPVIWQGSREIFLEHPILGVGPGGFKKATWKWRNHYLQSHPRMLYFFQNSPDGHAHNDLLHIAVVSGLPGAFLFLSLIYLVGSEIIRLDSKAFHPDQGHLQKRLFVSYGLAAFFVAGLFQCYFQDDEVVILLWALIGRYFGNSGKDDERL